MARPTLKRTFGFAALGSSLLLAGLLSACGDDEPDARGDDHPAVVVLDDRVDDGAGRGGPVGVDPGGRHRRRHPGVRSSRAATSCPGSPTTTASLRSRSPPSTTGRTASSTRSIPTNRSTSRPERRSPIPTTTTDEEDSDSESDEDEDTQDEASDDETEETQDLDDPRCADGTRQGTYTIEAGDIPANVAAGLDVTVDQLNEANANTPGYRAFIVGADILVPCGDEDE